GRLELSACGQWRPRLRTLARCAAAPERSKALSTKDLPHWHTTCETSRFSGELPAGAPAFGRPPLISKGCLMFLSDLRLAIAWVIKQPFYYAIKVLGLAVGILCAALLIGYVDFVKRYDSHIENRDSIYRV